MAWMIREGISPWQAARPGIRARSIGRGVTLDSSGDSGARCATHPPVRKSPTRGLLTPLAPERYASGIAPHPFLMVNGSEDSLIPTANVLALEHAARPPKELVWVRGEHVEPDATALLHQLSGIVTAWLVQRGLLPGDFP